MAFVVQTRNMRESNKLVVLYTQDFGLIYVTVQSVRKLESKMKHHLQSLSLVSVDLVRGKNIWRLVGIHEEHPSLSFVQTPWYPLLDKYRILIQRLCPGEEDNQELWLDISHVFDLMKQEIEVLPEFEIILTMRLLNHLGYWSGQELPIVNSSVDNQESVEFVRKNNTPLIIKINEVLRDTQL
jgi:recombinational DNA repair protein (RecF pathway)